MAKARMIHRTIATSEQVNNLSVAAELLFHGIIVHADDDGRLKGSYKFLKATILPMRQFSLKVVEHLLKEIVEQGLIYYWQQDHDWFIEIPTWKKYQQIQKDRYHSSILPSYPNKNVNKLDTPSIQTDNTMDTQSNVVKSNQIKDSEIKSNDSSIDNDSSKGLSGLRDFVNKKIRGKA